MAETAFLSALESYLGTAGLTPAPALIGAAEPGAADELPAIVMSLEHTERASNGLGERTSLITNGVLAWEATIDLANPVLPEEPAFVLIDGPRTTLTLPHGGLVKSDGSDPGSAPLSAADVTVVVKGASVAVVSGVPGPNQVRVDPLVGQARFGTPLDVAGTVKVSYFLGQWEQRLERISGVLRVDACGGAGDNVRQLADGVIAALLAPNARASVRRLLSIGLVSLSSVGASEPTLAIRRRTARFTFGFEQEINRPDSSGGIIRGIPINTKLEIKTVDPVAGTIVSSVLAVPA